jgi:hypothetical protein
MLMELQTGHGEYLGLSEEPEEEVGSPWCPELPTFYVGR